MATNTLIIGAWIAIAGLLIGVGIMEMRERCRACSLIFHPGNEWYADAYSDCIIGIERQWAERQRTP